MFKHIYRNLSIYVYLHITYQLFYSGIFGIVVNIDIQHCNHLAFRTLSLPAGMASTLKNPFPQCSKVLILETVWDLTVNPDESAC